MSTTRVTFVCQWYPPEPVEIPAGIVAALRDEGCDVRVLTGMPNYPTGVVADGYSARSVMEETRGGVRVRRVPLYPSHDTHAAKRLLNYASWALSAAALGQGPLRTSDVSLVYSSPATAALPAMLARILWRTPYVLLVQDVWPDSIFASGFLTGRSQRFVHGLADAFVRRAYAMASHVVVISPGMVDLLESRGVPRDKLTVVYNWLPDEGSTTADADSDLIRGGLGLPVDEPVFLYAGNHGRAQALEPLIDAFVDRATAPAHLVMVGSGVMKEALLARAAGAERVHFMDAVPREEAGRLVRAADVNVVSLADAPLFAVTMPSKVQAGLAAGRPMLVVSRGDSAHIVQKNGAGATARPGSAEEIIDAVVQLSSLPSEALSEMGRRGVTAYQETMARGVGASRLARVLGVAATQSPRGRRGSRPGTTNNEGESS